jgi:hypothetical protein
MLNYKKNDMKIDTRIIIINQRVIKIRVVVENNNSLDALYVHQEQYDMLNNMSEKEKKSEKKEQIVYVWEEAKTSLSGLPRRTFFKTLLNRGTVDATYPFGNGGLMKFASWFT